MDRKRAERVFPSFFKNINLPTGAKQQDIQVYRFCKWGKIEKKAFLSTYEEVKEGLTSIKDFDINTKDPGDYSTSCFEKKRDVKRMKKLFSRKNPKVIIAKGYTEGTCGPCQRTKERNPNLRNSHVDWWIYEGSNPEEYFEEINL